MIEFGHKLIEPINDDELRQVVIDNLYDKIILAKYKFDIVDKDGLEKLRENIYHVTLNNFGNKYFVMFMTYRTTKYCFYIDKRALKYSSKDAINLNEINIYSVKHCVNEQFYEFTLFDGDLIKNKYDHYVFIICDIYYLYNKNYLEVPIKTKLNQLSNIIISDYVPNNDIECCTFRVNKLYTYDDIQHILKTIISSIDYLCCGFVFYPLFSGKRYIKKFQKDEMPTHLIYNSRKNKKSKNIVRESIIKTSQQINKQSNEVDSSNNNNDQYSNQVNQINDMLKYKKNNNNQLCNLKNIKTYQKTVNFLIKKTDYPDVYNLYLHNKLDDIEQYISIAYIPTIKHSQFLFTLFHDYSETNLIVKCKYATDYKKWIPVQHETSSTMDDSEILNSII